MSSTEGSQGKPLRGFLLSLGGTIAVSTNFVTAKYGLIGFGSKSFSLIWTTAAAMYAILVLFIFDNHRSLLLPSRAVAVRVTILGLVTGAGMLLSWAGLAQLNPSFSSFLWRSSPILTILLSGLLLGESLSTKELLGAALIAGGSLLSAVGQWDVVGQGMILTLLASLSGAVQRVLAKTMADDVHPDALTFYRVGIGALSIGVWTLLTRGVDLQVEARYWSATLIGAFLGPSLSFMLTYRAYRHWDLSKATLVLMLQPVFVLIMAYGAFRTLPTAQELLGGIAILIGACWVVFVHMGRSEESDNQVSSS